MGHSSNIKTLIWISIYFSTLYFDNSDPQIISQITHISNYLSNKKGNSKFLQIHQIKF